MPLSGHDDLALFNDIANDAESTQKIENYVIIASLKSETMNKLINRIHVPGLCLLISSLPGSALRMHVESQALRCQQAFSKPRLVNLISKDTHLVFSIYLPDYSLESKNLHHRLHRDSTSDDVTSDITRDLPHSC